MEKTNGLNYEVFVIPNTRKGFLRRRNEAMLSSKADLVVILNDDIEVDGIKKSLKLFGKDEKLFTVTFDTSCDGSGKVLSANYANGGSSVYRREMWNELGGIDLLFEPAWWDDADLSERARIAGYHIVSDGRLIVRRTKRLMGVQKLRMNPYYWVVEKRNYILFLMKHDTQRYMELKTGSVYWQLFIWLAERRWRKFHEEN